MNITTQGPRANVCSTAPPTPGTLRSHMDDLHVAVSSLTDAINETERRLDPVLNNDYPVDDPCSTKAPPAQAASAMCESIQEAQLRVHGLTERVSLILRRLTV